MGFAFLKLRTFSRGKKLALNLGVLLLYIFLAQISSFFRSEFMSTFLEWIISGLSLAAILVYGLTTVLPGILLGILFITFLMVPPGVTFLGLVLAKLLEIALASMLLLAIGKGRFRLSNLKDVLNFIIIAGVLSPFISSTISVTFFYLGGINTVMIPDLWLKNFSSSLVGILVFTPFFLSFFHQDMRSEKAKWYEAVLLYVTLALVVAWSFSKKEPGQFLIIPFLAWAALRFSFRGVSIAAGVVAAVAIWKADFSRSLDTMLWIQALTGGIAIMGSLMATVSTTQAKVQEREKQLSINRKNTKIAEDALAILDQSLHMSPIGFALLDKEYRFIRINETLAKLHGVSVKDHLGMPISEILPKHAERMSIMMDRVFETGESLMHVPLQGQLNSNHHSPISGLISYYPIRRPESGEIFSVALTFQDLTQLLRTQNLLKENQERLTFAQEAGKMGAFEWCLMTNQVLWTPELEYIYGLERGEFGGLFESWMKLVHPDDVAIARKEFAEVIKQKKELIHEFRILTHDQDVRWILARGKVMVDDGQHVKLVGINIDLTEQKNYEHKLRVTEANLLQALSIRDEFVAIASHELKTPLTSLKLQMQMFKRSFINDEPSPPSLSRLSKFLDRNLKEIERLNRLVDDMLDMSRIRTGKLSLQKEVCDLTQILQDILVRTKEQFESSDSGEPVIEHFDHATGEWDALRINQVITNIISNAIRYGRGNPISISVKNYNETVRVSIKDQGLGIPESDQVKIFQRYERGLLKREVSGLGLGLFITQEIVIAHGGKIWLESEVNKGSTFHIELPRIIGTEDLENLFPMEEES